MLEELSSITKEDITSSEIEKDIVANANALIEQYGLGIEPIKKEPVDENIVDKFVNITFAVSQKTDVSTNETYAQFLEQFKAMLD